LKEVTPDALEVTAVLLNWNRADLTIRSARTLIADGLPPERVVVVDQASKDDDWLLLRQALGACHLARLDRNVGFARGNNLGARILPAHYLLLVNNDAFVHRKGSVMSLVRSLTRDRIGAAVPRLVNEDLSLQPSVVPLLRPTVAALRASGFSRFVPNGLQPRWATHWDHAESRPVNAANGAVLAIRGSVWNDLGGLREETFMYAEDIDFFWRLHARGWKAWFDADAEFIHLANTTARTQWDDVQRAEVVGLAEREMLREHLSPVSWRLVVACARVGEAARVVYHTLRGDDAAAAVSSASLRGFAGKVSDGVIPPSDVEPMMNVFPPAR
jgi:GT2 family glycosyltransferase